MSVSLIDTNAVLVEYLKYFLGVLSLSNYRTQRTATRTILRTFIKCHTVVSRDTNTWNWTLMLNQYSCCSFWPASVRDNSIQQVFTQ